MHTNLYYNIAVQVAEKLEKRGIKCSFKHLTKNNDSIYMSILPQNNYYQIRISDHYGKLHTRYSLRKDIKQSFKKRIDNQDYFLYSFNDFKGMINKISNDIEKINKTKK